MISHLFTVPAIDTAAMSEDELLTKSNEWYTPARYVDAARAVMGSIDVDPASCERANRTVKARRYYTEQEDGLSHSWDLDGVPSKVWLNPPYKARKDLGKKEGAYQLWVPKLVGEYDKGRVAQAILLLPWHHDRKWFQTLFRFPLCFCDHQILFKRPGRVPYHLYHALFFAYLGMRIDAFTEVFSEFGPVGTFVQARHRIQQLQLEVAP